MNITSLNSIWASLGITELSFLGTLKIIFLIILLVLNIVLLYCEYQKIEQTNNSDSPHYLKASAPELKKIATYIVTTLGTVASIITIKDDLVRRQKEAAEVNEKLAKAKEETKKITNEETTINFYNKLHMDSILRNQKRVFNIEEEDSELVKRIKEDQQKYAETGNILYANSIRRLEYELTLLKLEKQRVLSELQQDLERNQKFHLEISKEQEKSQILKMINENVKNSAIFDLDIEELLKKFANFETLDGLSKLMVTMILSNYLIL